MRTEQENDAMKLSLIQASRELGEMVLTSDEPPFECLSRVFLPTLEKILGESVTAPAPSGSGGRGRQ
jgi:hypothetical protein